MKRWAFTLGCALSLWGVGCDSSDSEGDGGGGTTAGTVGDSGGTGGSGAGGTNGGTSAGAGAGGAGNGGMSGAGAGGAGAGGAGEGGVGGGADDDAGTGEACGGRSQNECPDGSYCDYPDEADCGRFDAQGSCQAVTDMACGEIYQPVCGCDGETYSNPCEAMQALVSVDHTGECEGEEPEAKYDCTLEGVACLIAVPTCEEGKVPSADGACFGPCVAIEECACGGPDDCPNPEKYTCWMSAGHCGPYTQ